MGFVKHLLKRFKEDDYFGIPAQLAYFFLLSLFPLLIVLVSLFPYLPITQDDLLGTVRGFAPEGAIQLIEQNLEGMMQKNGTILSLGIIGTLWSASNGINAIVKVINRSYNVEEERAIFTKRLMADFINTCHDGGYYCRLNSACVWKTDWCFSLFTISIIR